MSAGASAHAGRGNGWRAVLLGLATAGVLMATEPRIGITWDEPAYIISAKSYASWFPLLLRQPLQALTPESIDAYWEPTHEHPSGERLVSGLVWLLARGALEEPASLRLGPMLLAGLLAAMLFHMIAGRYGRPAGLFAVLALFSMPRFFFHAHLAALDVPVTAAAFGVVFLFWQTIDRQHWAWALLWGIALGLALTFKLTAAAAPIALAVWSLGFRRRWNTAVRFLWMGLAALPAFFLAWPWIYFDTWPRLMEYFNFHLDHFPLGVWYFGQPYALAPWHYGLVMIVAVVPLTLMLLFLLALSRAGRGRHDGGLIWLLLVWASVSILPFIRAESVVFDNDRFFMPAFVCIAALAGIGFARAIGWLGDLARHKGRPALAVPAGAALGLLLLLPQVLVMARLYPHLLSYYSESVGGVRGASRLGFETTYWCETYSAAIPYINAHAEPGDLIWTEPLSSDVLLYYQSIGRLRNDVKPWQARGSPSRFPLGADWYIYQFRQSQTRGAAEESHPASMILRAQAPLHELSYEGVPLMRLYGPLATLAR